MGPEGAIASTHIFRFRSLRRAGRSLFRDRERLRAVEDLRFSRLVFVGSPLSEGFSFGPVDPRRQMAMCVWERESALDEFLESSPIGRAWLRDSDEYCEVRMTAFGTHGTYRGHEPFANLRRQRPGPGPVALWTFANIPPHGLRHFWTSIRHAARKLLSSEGLVAGTAGPEHLYRGAMTFTIWDSLERATSFSYREQPHKEIVRRVRERGLLTDSMFVRMRPYAARGSWPSYSRFGARFDALVAGLAAASAHDCDVEPSGPERAVEPQPEREEHLRPAGGGDVAQVQNRVVGPAEAA
jgi:hypothetical protein